MKRVLSLVMVCIIITGMLGVLPAYAEEKSGYKEGDIEMFMSFSDYDGVYGASGSNYKLPEGFINIDNGRVKNVGVFSFDDGVRASNVLKVGADGEPVLPFGTNFLDGYMHVSFDYYQTNENPETTTGRNLRVMFARNATNEASTNVYSDLSGTITVPADGETWNANEYDYTKLLKGQTMDLMIAGSKEAGIPRTLFNNNKRLIGVSDLDGTIINESATAEDTWYKVDMFFDRDTNEYKVYLNGALQDYGYTYTSGAYAETDLDSAGDFTAAGKRAIKGLILRCDHLRNNSDAAVNSGNTNGFVYLDNLYVSQYTANHYTNDMLKITADTKGQVMKNGSKLNIGFSEYLSAVPDASNIVITKNGEVFDGFTVTADKSQATITFTQELENGVYELSVTGVTGAVSGSAVSNTVEFTASGAGTEASATKFYYADESFNSLREGVVLPNWYYGNASTTVKDTYNRYYMPEADANFASYVKPATGADGTAAMELSAESGAVTNDMYYFFPRGVASGDFKAEFDIKHTNGGWTFGFVNYDHYNAFDNRGTYGYWNGAASTTTAPTVGTQGSIQTNIQNKMKSSILLGMAKNGYTADDAKTDGADVRALSPNLGMIGNDSTNVDRIFNVNNLTKQLKSGSESEYMTISENVWSKVEIDVNDNTKVYTVKVTPYKADGTLDTASEQTTVWTDTDNNRYYKGIMGIHFARNAHKAADLETYAAQQTGSVCIDNVKVYKTATAYLSEDFDDYTVSGYGTGKHQLPSGWSEWNREFFNNTRYSNADKNGVVGVTSGAGKSADANDKSMFLYYSRPIIYKTFDKPVPAGEPFVIEFDLYNVGTAASDSPWMLMQMGKDDTMQMPGYNYPKGVSKSGKVFIAPTNDATTGADGKTDLINDATIEAYAPFASTTDDSGNTVTYTAADTYARINGNFMRMNVFLGRSNDSFLLNYSETGRLDANRAFHLNQNEKVSTTMTEVGNTWINYKILCEPVSKAETKYTLTQTIDGGEPVTAEFTNARDWFTQDTYAIGFAIPNKASQKSNTSDGSIGTMIDNIKVYAADSEGSEIAKVANNYIESVKAVSGEDEKDITAGENIPNGTTKLEITFSAPINEKINPQIPALDESLPEVRNDREDPSNANYKGTFTGYFDAAENYHDYTSILDSIKDVISLRETGSQTEAAYTVALSADKKTVTLTFAEGLSEGEAYTLGVNKNIAFDGDGYATLDGSFVKTYDVSGGFSEEEINVAKLNITVFRGTADIPVNKAGALVAGETVTSTVDYENTGDEDIQAFAGYAFYEADENDADSKVLSYINPMILDIKANSKGTMDEVTFSVPDSGYSVFKGFLWEYPSMKPYGDVIETK